MANIENENFIYPLIHAVVCKLFKDYSAFVGIRGLVCYMELDSDGQIAYPSF